MVNNILKRKQELGKFKEDLFWKLRQKYGWISTTKDLSRKRFILDVVDETIKFCENEVLKPLNKIKKYIDCINPKYCSCKRCPNCNIFYHKLVKAVDDFKQKIEGKK